MSVYRENARPDDIRDRIHDVIKNMRSAEMKCRREANRSLDEPMKMAALIVGANTLMHWSTELEKELAR